jgi:hypothetical protein
MFYPETKAEFYTDDFIRYNSLYRIFGSVGLIHYIYVHKPINVGTLGLAV